MYEFRKVRNTCSVRKVSQKVVSNPFMQAFGDFIPSLNDYQAPASWQSAISQSPSIGSVFGVYWGGYLNDRFGYKKSLIINYIMVIPCIGQLSGSICLYQET